MIIDDGRISRTIAPQLWIEIGSDVFWRLMWSLGPLLRCLKKMTTICNLCLNHISPSVHVKKEYYEIIIESPTLCGILPHRCRFCLQKNAFLLKKLSNLPSFRAIQALISSQSTFEKLNDEFIILFSYCLLLFVSHFTQVW